MLRYIVLVKRSLLNQNRHPGYTHSGRDYHRQPLATCENPSANAAVLSLSKTAEPVDLITVTRLTRPVFKSISSRYKPSPRKFRDQLVGSLDCARKGYDGARAQIMSRAHKAFGWRLP